MAAAYDTYDYLSYWLGRGYEHKAEVAAVKDLLAKIKSLKTILEVGAGFGRLVGSYSFRAKKVIITDQSSKLLKIARDRFPDKKYKFIHSSIENLPVRVRSGTIDLVVMVRVIHHIGKLDESIEIVRRMLKNKGYFILEYPNKRNLKAVLIEFFQGNFTFFSDILTKDLRSKRSLRLNALPFFNYHPHRIEKLLIDHNFEILEKRSVSNLRSSPLKKALSTHTLISIEKMLQKPLSYLSVGPSMFILARKMG